MSCEKPMDAAVLADYWLALLAQPQEDAVEEHLLGCDACGARLREVIALIEGVRKLTREGSLRMVVSDEYLKRAAQEGLHVREYTVPQNGSVQCTVTAEDDLLIGRLTAQLGGAKRVDVSLCNELGEEMARLPDIPIFAGAASVNVQESIGPMKAAPDFKLIARLIAVDEAGEESPLGEYTFNHSRTMPGPAGW
jgi:hypothetical protein